MSTTTFPRTVLNLGCGITPLPEERFPLDKWQQVRVDLDAGCRPDVVADVRDLPFADATADAAVLLGVLEHFCETEVPVVLGECWRVLRPGGSLVVLVPDLLAVAREIVAGRLLAPLGDSSAGPIRPLDILYGFSPALAAYPLYAHRTGFTSDSLATALATAGFEGSLQENSGSILRAEARKL